MRNQIWEKQAQRSWVGRSGKQGEESDEQRCDGVCEDMKSNDG